MNVSNTGYVLQPATNTDKTGTTSLGLVEGKHLLPYQQVGPELFQTYGLGGIGAKLVALIQSTLGLVPELILQAGSGRAALDSGAVGS